MSNTPIKHAVLTDAHLVTIHPTERKIVREPLTCSLSHVSDIWQLAQQTKVTHVWVMPNSQVDAMGAALFKQQEPYNIFAATDEHELPKFGRVWKKQALGHVVYIGYPARGSFQWNVKTPLDILATVDYLERALGVTVQWSTGHMGYTLLKKMYSTTDKLRSYVRESDVPLKELPFNKAARDVLFCKPLTMDMVGMWIHHYDKNSAYLAACTGVMCGSGTPTHEVGNVAPDKAGIYRVSYELPKDTAFNGVALPSIINTLWVTRDVLKFSIEQGYEVTVHEAYTFEESHRLLEKWAAHLWETRATLKNASQDYCYEQGRINAYNTIKEIALIGVGSLATKKYEHEFMRPNWWADVVGRARVTILATLNKYTQAGYAPILVYSDGVWFSSHEQDIRKAIPNILDKEGKLGGYKAVYSVQVTEEMVIASQSLCVDRTKAGKMVTYLHKRAGYR